PGGIPFGPHFFHCWKKGGHGAVNLHKAIVESCDVFFYQAGRRLGVDGIAEYAHRLGLGLPTGIALPHEQSGTIPDTAWKRRRFDLPWFEGETLSVAIGQGYVTVTPLQMANLPATIAYAPLDAPEIAIACIIEHAGGGGGAFAAPVVQQVLAHYFDRNQGPMPPTLQANAVRPPTDHAL